MKKSLVVLLLLFTSTAIYSQDLTISTSGQIGTSGTNWSIIGNTLTVGASGSASIHPSVITDHLTNTGNLTIVLPPQSLQSRDIIISNNIAYTGSTARTLTFNSANGIWINSGVNISSSTSSLNLVLRAAMNSSAPDHGRIVLDGVAISTKGGHFWAGGGSTNATWNGLTVGNGSANVWADDVAALSMVVASITTEGGSVYLNGRSWDSADSDGVNYGVYIENTTISTQAGNITIVGQLNGRYTHGNATRIVSTSSGNTAITTTTGSISVSGTGLDQTPNDNGFRFGVIITGWSSTAKTIISSNSGNIQIEGNANFTATVNDKEGLGIGGSTEIISRSGNISIRGTNSLESSGQYCNSIRLDPRNESNSIRVGFDGTNSYAGNILIEGNSIYQRYLHSSAGSIAVQTTGTLTIQPSGTAFTYMRADNAGTLTYDDDWNFGTTLTGFTFGKSTNTLDLNYNGALSVAGPIAVYGGNININENLNTVAGGTTGTILLKSSADIILAASKSITTSGAPVILWSNSDNASSNGSIALRNASSIVTGSNIVAGGHVWIGGGSNGTTWNGLAVGLGYAVPGTSFTPSNGGNSIQSGIYLERNSISSFGGNIKIAGDGAASARGIVSYGNTITINAGSGKIEMDGQVTSAAAGNRGGILLGLHENTIASTVNISSSSTTGDAITLTGVGRGTEDAIGLSGTLNITSSGGGNIVMNGNALGSGRSIVAGNYYHGVMNVFANSGNIILNGNTKAVQVATQIIGGLTSGPSKINIGQGGTISSSSSDVFITADNIALAAGGIAINASGQVTLEPASNSFASAITFPIANLSISNNISGLTIGKPSNTANITIGGTTSIAGAITAYGGSLAINENLSSSTGSTISLYGNTLSFGSGKTVSSANGQLIVAPQNPALTIGMAGATGDLSLPASYFSTNFTDGFSNIQIGSNSQTGAISINAFTLRDNMTFLTTGSLSLGGKPVLGSNNVTLGSGISSISGTPTHYFQTTSTGTVNRTLTNSASLLFPIGNAAYNPISIQNKTGSSDLFSARVIDSVFLNGVSGTLITTPHVKATWDISKTNANAGDGIDMTFSWNQSQEVGGISNFILNHHDGSGWKIAAGTTGRVSGTTTQTITHTGYTGSFSPFAFGNSSTPLPIELIAFNAQCMNDFILIKWTTSSEINNKMFELYKSDNALDWELIHTESGQGDKASETNYQFMDYKKQAPYYRLKDIDFDGIENWSHIIFEDCESNTSKTEVYPNPASDFIKVTSEIDEKMTLRILSLDGRILKTLPLVSEQTLVDIKTLVPGFYIIEIINQKSTTTFKINKI